MSSIFMPFILGALFAYLGDPLVSRLVRWRLPRTVAATIVFSIIILIIIGFILLLIPLLEGQIQVLITKMPIFISWIQDTAIPWLQLHFDFIDNLSAAQVKTILMNHWQQTSNVADKVVTTVSQSTMTIVAIIINLVLIPVVTFYLLRDWPLVVERMKNMVPRRYLASLTEILRQCNNVLGAFFRGQFLVMLVLGVIYSVGLMIIGLDLAILIGILIAILSIVPYLGTVIGLIAAITASVFQFHDFIHVVYVLVLFGVGHVLEGMVLTPWLIGDRVGLHPVAVIFAILLGGALFGFFGILLAIPVAAVVLVLLKFFYRGYKNSDFYKK